MTPFDPLLFVGYDYTYLNVCHVYVLGTRYYSSQDRINKSHYQSVHANTTAISIPAETRSSRQ